MKAFRRQDFDFELPEELIAQYPTQRRSASRLLRVARNELADAMMVDLPEYLSPNDLLIFNDTRVIPARLFGRKATGGRVEILVERIIGSRQCLAQLGVSKTPKAGGRIVLGEDGPEFEVLGRDGDLFELQLVDESLELMTVLDEHGRLPLPPYITHAPGSEDLERYQTVFAQNPGAVAAPTAGLHFDEALLDAIRARGVRTATLTLHVGAGTFQPVRVDDLAEHRMHMERYCVPESLLAEIERTRSIGGRICAVGTTVTRTLESAADADGNLQAGWGETRLFITPGYRFRVVDCMLTNFHLPQSTLLMLVCAFGGYDNLLGAYQHAVAQRYRFFSYGDAMLLARR